MEWNLELRDFNKYKNMFLNNIYFDQFDNNKNLQNKKN